MLLKTNKHLEFFYLWKLSMDVQAAGSLFAVVAPNPDMETDTLPETVVKHNKITQCNVMYM